LNPISADYLPPEVRLLGDNGTDGTDGTDGNLKISRECRVSDLEMGSLKGRPSNEVGLERGEVEEGDGDEMDCREDSNYQP